MTIHCSFHWIARISGRGRLTLERDLRKNINLFWRDATVATTLTLDICKVAPGPCHDPTITIIGIAAKGPLVRIRTGVGNQVVEAVLHGHHWVDVITAKQKAFAT